MGRILFSKYLIEKYFSHLNNSEIYPIKQYGAKRKAYSKIQKIKSITLLLFISINTQRIKPKKITSKDIQIINKGFPIISNINPSGMKIRRARSIKGIFSIIEFQQESFEMM